jgi:hypothetical protein
MPHLSSFASWTTYGYRASSQSKSAPSRQCSNQTTKKRNTRAHHRRHRTGDGAQHQRSHARLSPKEEMSDIQSEARALGTKVLQPSVSLSPGAAFRTSFIICTVCPTSAIVSPGMPTIPYSFSASSPPSWALTAAVTMSACSNFLLTILRGRNAQSG